MMDTVRTEQGDEYRRALLIAATGCLTARQQPKIKGIESSNVKMDPHQPLAARRR